MESFENTWEIKSDSAIVDFAFATTKEIAEPAKLQMPQFAEVFPFRRAWEANGILVEDTFAVLLREKNGSGVPLIGEIKESELIKRIQEFSKKKTHPSFDETYREFGDNYFKADQILYIGNISNSKLSWHHIQTIFVEWLNKIVVPVILKNNEKRVLSAIPTPP